MFKANIVKIGKLLAAVGASLTAVGISLNSSSSLKEVLISAGVFITAVSVYLAHSEIKKINGGT
jgi:sulfite exporter TauE/SafE